MTLPAHLTLLTLVVAWTTIPGANMNSGDRAVELIQALAKREEGVVSTIEAPKSLPRPSDRLAHARRLFLAKSDERQVAPPEWANCPAAIPSATMVDVNYPLVVDIRLEHAVSERDFIAGYGMSPCKLARYAAKGIVLLNLYEFSSDLKRGFARHRACGQVILPLLQPEAGCRINFIRRERLLQHFGFDSNRGREDAKRLFEFAFRSIPSGFEEVVGARDVEDGIVRTGERLEYLRILGADSLAVRSFLDGLEAERPNASTLPDCLRTLGALKQIMATRYTAVFGGCINLVDRDADAVLSLYGKVRTAVRLSEVDEEFRGAVENLLAPIGVLFVDLAGLSIEADLAARMELASLVSRLLDVSNRLAAAGAAGDHGQTLAALEDKDTLTRQLYAERRRLGVPGPSPDKQFVEQSFLALPGYGGSTLVAAGREAATIGLFDGAAAALHGDSLRDGGVAKVIDLAEERRKRGGPSGAS